MDDLTIKELKAEKGKLITILEQVEEFHKHTKLTIEDRFEITGTIRSQIRKYEYRISEAQGLMSRAAKAS